MSAYDRADSTEIDPDRLRLLDRSSTLVSLGLLAAMVVASALAYATLPSTVTVHWQIGIDGSLSTRTVGRTIGVTIMPVIAATTWTALEAIGRWLGSRDELVGVVCSVLAAATVTIVALAHVLVLGLNLL
ncbi:DUF1648 domain-containing protein [Natranaeroarchaeum sulfidigenes]|uniref:DUF1648 domain-containing protein n=1 Tax=Natranaeroarchaeum sulfidigenes TaxID=2784880 RepID=A0A897MW92_9EURY|nr:DUF1648 domain-containing protein [Natranaeroarchaeum sulfidigenes]QSG02426.1 hypothetical protein AArcS_1208 [Natranaeroarchaeum sulfidigenes]